MRTIQVTETLTSKIVKDLIENNEFVTINVDEEWTLNKNAMFSNSIIVTNNFHIDKRAYFDGKDSSANASKFIMSKYSYLKNRLKRGNDERLPIVTAKF